MSQNMISKAYHSAKALHTDYKNHRKDQKELHDLKVRAADSSNPNALDVLKQEYERRGLPVTQLYVKASFPGGKVRVSRKPPVFGKKSAQEWFAQLEAILKKNQARATQKALTKVIEHPANDCTDSGETAAWNEVIRDLDEVLNPVDDLDIRELRSKRSQKLDETFALVRDFNTGPTDPTIGTAIERATNMPLFAAMDGAAAGFASALTHYLPTPPGSSPDISDGAKLDHYLRNTKLSAHLDDAQLALVKDHYLDLWAEQDKSEAAAKAGQTT